MPPMPYITIAGSPSGPGVEDTPPDTPITFVRSNAAITAASLKKDPSTPEKDKDGSAPGSTSSSTRHSGERQVLSVDWPKSLVCLP